MFYNVKFKNLIKLTIYIPILMSILSITQCDTQPPQWITTTLMTDAMGRVVFEGLGKADQSLIIECGDSHDFTKKLAGVSVAVSYDQYSKSECLYFIEDQGGKYYPSSRVIDLANDSLFEEPLRVNLYRIGVNEILSYRKTFIKTPNNLLLSKIETIPVGALGFFLKENSDIKEVIFLGMPDEVSENDYIDIYESPLPEVAFAKNSDTSDEDSSLNQQTKMKQAESPEDEMLAEAMDTFRDALNAASPLKIKLILTQGFVKQKDLFYDVLNHNATTEFTSSEPRETSQGKYSGTVTVQGQQGGPLCDLDRYVINWGDGSHLTYLPKDFKDNPPNWTVPYTTDPHEYANPGLYIIILGIEYNDAKYQPYCPQETEYMARMVVCGKDAEAAEADFEAGLDFAKEKDYESAIQKFTNTILLMDGKDILTNMALYNRALAYEALGNCEDAISDFQQILDTDWHPWNPVSSDGMYFSVSQYSIGVCFEQLGEEESAIEAYQKVIDNFYDFTYPVLAQHAIDRLMGYKPDLAITDFKVIERRPSGQNPNDNFVYTLEVTIENKGDAKTYIWTPIYYGEGKSIKGAPKTWTAGFCRDNLSPGMTTTQKINYACPKTGTYYVTAKVDPWGEIDEHIEENNEKFCLVQNIHVSSTTTTKAPDDEYVLKLTSVEVSDHGFVGGRSSRTTKLDITVSGTVEVYNLVIDWTSIEDWENWEDWFSKGSERYYNLPLDGSHSGIYDFAYRRSGLYEIEVSIYYSGSDSTDYDDTKTVIARPGGPSTTTTASSRSTTTTASSRSTTTTASSQCPMEIAEAYVFDDGIGNGDSGSSSYIQVNIFNRTLTPLDLCNFKLEIDWGDGQVDETNWTRIYVADFNLYDHSYISNSSFTVTIRLFSKSGLVDSKTLSLTPL